MHIDRERLPSWARYVVICISNPAVQGACSNVEKVAEYLIREDLQFDSQVIRVDGDVLVWPIHSKGGNA